MSRKPHFKNPQQYETYHDLNGQGHLRSNVKMVIEGPRGLSYMLLIVTICLASNIKDLQQFGIHFNAFLMRNDKVSYDLYRGQTDLSFTQHVDLW